VTAIFSESFSRMF